ncbi:MAG: 4Fe-4S dicluster domain-containing protein [Deltaproteobacteria bacterium]|nr:4Fe-4S dicluster domain-containing protein [Deltaproteobacteria bacterium]
MAFVIGETCEMSCDRECVAVCPVEAIHGPREVGGRVHLVIDPDACICCAACEAACPVQAIFDGDG